MQTVLVVGGRPGSVRLWRKSSAAVPAGDHLREDRPERIAFVARRPQNREVVVDIVPQLSDSIGPSALMDEVEGLPSPYVPPVRIRGSSEASKRVLDLVGPTVALVLRARARTVLAISIRLNSSAAVCYRQQRVGWGGAPRKPFTFRTMSAQDPRGSKCGGVQADEAFARLLADPARRAEFETAVKLQAEPRTTLKMVSGHLTLLGPRPLTPEMLARREARAGELLKVMPGATGYCQINEAPRWIRRSRCLLRRPSGSRSRDLEHSDVSWVVSTACRTVGRHATGRRDYRGQR